MFNYLSLIGLGAINTLAYSPFDWWWLPIFSLVPLLLLSNNRSPTQAAKMGFCYGIGWFTAGLSWVHVAIADFGEMPLILSLLLLFILCAYLALFPALALWITSHLKSKFSHWVLVPAWIFSEQLRSILLTGFPWLSLGYSQTSSPLAGFAPIIGELGIQAIILVMAMTISLFIRRISANPNTFKTNSLIYSGLLLIPLVLGHALQKVNWELDGDSKGREVTVALVQGNIAQSIKWQPDNELPTMMLYSTLTEPLWSQSDLIIWPEAAIPKLEILSTEFLLEMDRIATMNNSALITGIVNYSPSSQQAFNSLITLGVKQNAGAIKSNDADITAQGHYYWGHNNRYNKHHLLPIGEFVPFESFLRKLGPIFNLPMSSFNRGHFIQDNLIANDIHLAAAICFEIAFPRQLAANIHDNTDAILTVSNDAWFGNSHGPWQHLQIAQMRALEFAKPVIRATNNGVSAIIGNDGTVIAQLPQNQKDSLVSKLNLISTLTFYQQWRDIPLYSFFSLWLLIIYLIKRFKKMPKTE